MRVDWSNYLTETFFIVLVLFILPSAWAQIGATLLQLEQPCSNWGYLVYIDLL